MLVKRSFPLRFVDVIALHSPWYKSPTFAANHLPTSSLPASKHGERGQRRQRGLHIFATPSQNHKPSPPTTDASLNTCYYPQAVISQLSFHDTSPSVPLDRVRRDSMLTPDEDVLYESSISVKGNSDGSQPVIPFPHYDTHLSPLMQWHEKEKDLQHPRYVSYAKPLVLSLIKDYSNPLDSAAHLCAPSSSLLCSSKNDDIEHRSLSRASASAFSLPYKTVEQAEGSYSQPCPRTSVEADVGYLPLLAKNRAVPSSPPPPPFPSLAAWAVHEQSVKTIQTSPYGPTAQISWQQPEMYHGLHIITAASNCEATLSSRHSINHNTYDVAVDDGSALYIPTSGLYPVVGFDDSPHYYPPTLLLHSSATPVTGRCGMEDEDGPGQRRSDETTFRKQKAFRRKAKAAKQQSHSCVADKSPTKLLTSNLGKRKSRTREPNFEVQQTAAPALRNAPSHGLPDPYGYDDSLVVSVKQQTFSSDAPAFFSEEINQPITTDYESYRWPVKLYTVDKEKTGHHFAESWIQAICGMLQDGIKWHTHATKGFIQGGTQLSFLVLHNAFNPFKYGDPPKHTTSIGCYGFYEQQHFDIRWTTLAMDLRELLKGLVDEGLITEDQKWHPNMKPLQKRFHRAYWLAATMSPLKTMLNRKSDETVVESVESVEIHDEDFGISELDLNNEGCEQSKHEAERRWKECEEIAEGETPGYTPEHIVTGSSEW
jgi:hypothetical protein